MGNEMAPVADVSYRDLRKRFCWNSQQSVRKVLEKHGQKLLCSWQGGVRVLSFPEEA